MSGKFARSLSVSLVVLMFLAPLTLAQVGEPPVEGRNVLTYYPTPKSANAEAQKDLFVTVTALAIFVFIFVQGLLLYILFRFRRNRRVPQEETHRGHTRAEIVWTIIPAVILLFIGVISAQTMEDIDKIPDTDFTVKVEGFQWGWNFGYPDGSVDSNLYVKEGKRVRLEITSRDVIHAVWIPALGVKLDAVPGKTNVIWFDTNAPGTYVLKCAEFCYSHLTDSNIGHHSMVSQVVVCPKDDAACADFGAPRGIVDTDQVGMQNIQFIPTQARVAPGTTVTWTNNEAVPHTVTPDDASLWGGAAGSALLGKDQTYTFTFSTAGNYTYHCIPHSFRDPATGQWKGMVGTIVVEP